MIEVVFLASQAPSRTAAQLDSCTSNQRHGPKLVRFVDLPFAFYQPAYHFLVEHVHEARKSYPLLAVLTSCFDRLLRMLTERFFAFKSVRTMVAKNRTHGRTSNTKSSRGIKREWCYSSVVVAAATVVACRCMFAMLFPLPRCVVVNNPCAYEDIATSARWYQNM